MDYTDVKYDYLVTEICDKITTCMELMKEDGVFSSKANMRELYNEHLHPDVLPIEDEKLWNALGNGEVLDVFQFSTGVGLATAKLIKPRNPVELTSANALMRLMGEKGKERPLDRYCRLRKNINLWYDECRERKLTEEEIKILEPYYLPNFGVPASQEDLMEVCMDEKIAHFTLGEANTARKIVSKKQLNKIPELKEKFISQCPNEKFGEYVWETTMEPQMSYAFAKPHATAYSFVGIQTLKLATYYPSIYWNTACLIVKAGGADLLDAEDEIEDNEEEVENTKKKNKSVNYGKISIAIGESKNSGIEVLPPDINKSKLIFTPDINSNAILYGMKGINRIGTQLVFDIFNNRPYTSIEDFMSKVKVNKTQMINLIKAGTFDSIYSDKTREQIMDEYILSVSDQKKRITLQNMMMLIKFNLIPKEYELEVKIFNFNKYLKSNKDKLDYVIDEIAMPFYTSNFDEDYLSDIKINGEETTAKINQKTWDNIYKKAMDPLRAWMKENQQEILNELNNKLYEETAEKYTEGSLSKWEMDSLGFYYHEHELEKTVNLPYDINDFFNLPEEPIVEKSFPSKQGGEIKLFELSRICGTVIDKDKNKNSVTLLTPTGVVTVKVWKSQYAVWDRQLSQKDSDGKKHVIEKSWFTRGNKLIITGIRRGDDFVPKVYKNTTYPLFEKINEIDSKGFIINSQTTRAEVEE